MDISRHGIILNVENFESCVEFYRNVFNLPLMFEKVEGSFKLCCLQYGDGYLMIETDGVASPGGKSIAQCPTKFRFNVADIDQALARLKKLNIEAAITSNDWGSTINIFDPDGNRIGIRDEAGFSKQIGSWHKPVFMPEDIH